MRFDVAPDAAAWVGSDWIGGGSELRMDWRLSSASPIVRARAYAAGLGAFELFVNGEKVGDHLMDAGQAVWDEKVLYAGFNVTNSAPRRAVAYCNAMYSTTLGSQLPT